MKPPGSVCAFSPAPAPFMIGTLSPRPSSQHLEKTYMQVNPMNSGRDERRSRLKDFLEHPRRAVWTMAMPMMAGMLFHTLYSIVDTVFVGRLGPESLAALTFVMPLFFVGIALANGITVGVVALVSQSIGRGDSDEADLVATNALSMALGGGLLLSGAAMMAGEPLLRSLGAQGATVDQAWAYFRILVLGVPLFFISGSLRSVLMGSGDARTPMLVMAAATLTNLALDPIFIFVLDFGIAGAAMATLAAQLMAMSVFAYVVLIRRKTYVRFRKRYLKPQAAVLLRIAAIGVPTAASMLVMSAGGMLGNRLLSTFGQLAVAGYGAANRVDMLVSMPVMGLAASTITIIGMFSGARRADLVRSTTLYSYRWALIFALGLGTLAYLSSHYVMSIFTKDPEAIAVGRLYLGYMIFAYPLMAIGMVSGRILQGLGYGMPALVITAVRVLVVGIPAAYAAVFLFDAPIDWVWICMIFGGLCSTVLSVLWIRKVIWKQDPTAKALRRRPAPLGHSHDDLHFLERGAGE